MNADHVMRASGAALAAVLALAAAAPAKDAHPADDYLYLPPALARRVAFYHSFSRGADRPEINRLAARLAPVKGRLVAGLTGKGLTLAAKGRSVSLQKLELPLTRPITASMWWRLDEEMKPESGFHLVSLRANGYISNFVRGKGQWCALKKPTFVLQIYRFPGISNVNGIRFGDAWVAAGVWHHAAVTVSAGSKVRVYWDGRLRSEVSVKGRLFAAGDVVRSIDFGPHWLGHPMTIDELLVLDRALSPAEVGAYVTAVRKLAEAKMPFRAGG